MILLFLLSFTIGCSRRNVIEHPIIIIPAGDPQFLEPTLLPDNPAPTTAGLIEYIIDCRQSVAACNADKKAFRGMMEQQQRDAESRQ